MSRLSEDLATPHMRACARALASSMGRCGVSVPVGAGGEWVVRWRLSLTCPATRGCWGWVRGCSLAHDHAGLLKVRSLQFQMTGCVGKWYPHLGEDRPWFAQRCATRSRVRWRQSGIPQWDHAMCSSWGRRAGHAARLSERCPERWLAKTLGRLDTWYRHTTWHLQASPNHTMPSTRRRCLSGKRHWDEMVQCTVTFCVEVPSQTLAQDRVASREVEPAFIAKATRVSPAQVACVPRGTT